MIGAVIKEQGVTFAVVLVHLHLFDMPKDADELIAFLSPHFRSVPVVLAAQDRGGRFVFYGREDIARFLGSVDPNSIAWREYTST